MEKKISLTTENGEVVSIEINGVLYANPDDIPDPEDRAKVKALISKTDDEDDLDDEFEPPFDEQEFQREFEAVQQESRKFPTVLFSVFLAVAGIMLAIAAFSAFQAYRAQTREQSAPGKVVDTIERRSVDNQDGTSSVYSYPVVEFTLPDGSPQRVEVQIGSWPPEFQAGDAVTVQYDPEHPVDAQIKSFSSTLMRWLLPAITGIIGTVFLIITLVILRVHQSQNENVLVNTV